MNKNKQLVINMAASFIAFVVSVGINFFLSPYIVKKLGVEAYGFIGLANNMINYISILTIALNSLAGRFITIAIYEKNENDANKYFTSVFYANAVLSGVLLILGISVILYLEYIIKIPNNLILDVKTLMLCLLINCIISMLGTVYGVAVFAKNMLYLNSLRNIESNIIRAVFLCGMFFLFSPKVSYMGISALVVGFYTTIFNIYYTYKFLPDLTIKRRYFDLKAVWMLITSGIWNTINRLGQIFTDGLDLLITNIFIDSASMGILSLAKVIPAQITTIVGTLVGVFSPNFTILYAEKKFDELIASVKQSMKIMGIFCNIPIIILIVCGDLFFKLWQPTQNAKELHILSILICSGLIISGGINCIFNIFTVVNKLKLNAVLLVLSGFLNVVIVYLLLKFTNLGIYAIAGVSSVIVSLKNLFFVVPYGAVCLNQKWYTFYQDIFKSIAFVIFSVLASYLFRILLPSEGWISLILIVFTTGVISLFIGLFIVFNKSDRLYILGKVFKVKKV